MVFKKNNKPWNKGLTKYLDKRIRKYSTKLNGHKAWNKGLTKENDKRVMKNSRHISISLKGRIFSDKHKKNIGLSSLGRKLTKKGKTFEKFYGLNKAKVSIHKESGVTSRSRISLTSQVIIQA